ncbi:MAG: TIGR00341 family protein [Chitinophagaceae bacterium]
MKRKVQLLLQQHFNLNSDDREEESAVILSITRSIPFGGANLWTLVFAIIIASVGLNVNSTAVVIGAMLISPLMGPIMGVGMGMAISDFNLVRKGLKNLLIAVFISVATSSLYFWLTPLHDANSELLARTTPTIWDVFIAFSGGLAGMVGSTRKEKSNVIPGVAIATALMPPLCTAGFGIATGNWLFLLGAMYLFFINSLFICIGTILIARAMHFHKQVIENEARRKKMTRYMILVVVVTVIPSIWLAYRIVQKTVFDNAAAKYVHKEFNFTNTLVVNKNFEFSSKNPRIELLLMGKVLDSVQIDTLESHLADYHLKGTKLIVRQGLDAKQEINFAQVKASILDEVFSSDSSRLLTFRDPVKKSIDLKPQIKALFPKIKAFSNTKTVFFSTDTLQRDTVVLVVADVNEDLDRKEKTQLEGWLRTKFIKDSVQVLYRRVR